MKCVLHRSFEELKLLQSSVVVMPKEDQFSDDYVASLLAKDAKDSTARYLTSGLQALLPRR